jgi:NADH-quinone oxidoreductase subunit A
MKDSPFECGVPPVGDAQHRISVRFYLVAILFLLFDIEVIFFFPFGVVFRDYLAINSFLIWEMGVFVALLLVGYVYVVRKGALNWD